ncbi:BspA family leucine-rich repeat surface protein [Pseudomonas sp. HK3]
MNLFMVVMNNKLNIFMLFIIVILINGCDKNSIDGEEKVISVIDREPPNISLIDDENIYLTVGSLYIDPGAVANDNVDLDVNISVRDDVDASRIGRYVVTYKAVDQAGNLALLNRNIYVLDPKAFVTTWKVGESPYKEGNHLKINTITSDQNYNIDWGDGFVSEGVAGSISHHYVDSGIYTVIITGDFKNIKVGHYESHKLLTIEQWGDIKWTTMDHAFSGCHNLKLNAIDSPNLELVNNMRAMFNMAENFTGDVSNWDVSSVETMVAMFMRASSFNSDLSRWDVSVVVK